MWFECTLQRNCSMTPRQVARAYAVLCSVSLAVALDRERISLSTSCLLIECVQANVRSQARLDPLRTRVLPPTEPLPAGARRPLITLESRGVRIEVGRFVNEAKRRQVARELRQALRQVSALP